MSRKEDILGFGTSKAEGQQKRQEMVESDFGISFTDQGLQ